MNKEKIIKETAKATGLTQWQTQRTIEAFLNLIQDTVKKGEPVKLLNFGKFEKKTHQAKTISNPTTHNKPYVISERNNIKFTTGKKFKEYINE